MNKKMRKLLYRSFDQSLTESEANSLENYKKQYPEFQKETALVLEIRKNLMGNNDETFSPFFAEKVVNNLAAAAKKMQNNDNFNALLSVFRPVAFATSLVIAGILIYNLNGSNVYHMEDIFGIPAIGIENITYAIQ